VLPLSVKVAGHTQVAPFEDGMNGDWQVWQTLSVWQSVQNWAEQA